jgi:hypothetical protein
MELSKASGRSSAPPEPTSAPSSRPAANPTTRCWPRQPPDRGQRRVCCGDLGSTTQARVRDDFSVTTSRERIHTRGATRRGLSEARSQTAWCARCRGTVPEPVDSAAPDGRCGQPGDGLGWGRACRSRLERARPRAAHSDLGRAFGLPTGAWTSRRPTMRRPPMALGAGLPTLPTGTTKTNFISVFQRKRSAPYGGVDGSALLIDADHQWSTRSR